MNIEDILDDSEKMDFITGKEDRETQEKRKEIMKKHKETEKKPFEVDSNFRKALGSVQNNRDQIK